MHAPSTLRRCIWNESDQDGLSQPQSLPVSSTKALTGHGHSLASWKQDFAALPSETAYAWVCKCYGTRSRLGAFTTSAWNKPVQANRVMSNTRLVANVSNSCNRVTCQKILYPKNRLRNPFEKNNCFFFGPLPRSSSRTDWYSPIRPQSSPNGTSEILFTRCESDSKVGQLFGEVIRAEDMDDSDYKSSKV